MDNRNDYTPLNNYDQPIMKAPKKKKNTARIFFILFIVIGIILGITLYFLFIKP